MSIYRGKKVLITGASSGIGFSLAEELAKRGSEVFISARSRDKLEALAQKIENLGLLVKKHNNLLIVKYPQSLKNSKEDYIRNSRGIIIDFENKNPISLLIVPISDNELSLFSISFFIFNLRDFGNLIEWKYSRFIFVPMLRNEISIAS